MSRYTAIVVVAAVSTAAATAAALAAVPKPGQHVDTQLGPGGATIVLSMAVDDGVVTGALGNDPDCPTDDGLIKGFRITKSIKVKDNGKFKFDGKTAQNTSTGTPPKIHVVLKGKFSSSKKASGTYTIEGCPGKVSWETEYIP